MIKVAVLTVSDSCFQRKRLIGSSRGSQKTMRCGLFHCRNRQSVSWQPGNLSRQKTAPTFSWYKNDGITIVSRLARRNGGKANTWSITCSEDSKRSAGKQAFHSIPSTTCGNLALRIGRNIYRFTLRSNLPATVTSEPRRSTT